MSQILTSRGNVRNPCMHIHITYVRDSGTCYVLVFKYVKTSLCMHFHTLEHAKINSIVYVN